MQRRQRPYDLAIREELNVSILVPAMDLAADPSIKDKVVDRLQDQLRKWAYARGVGGDDAIYLGTEQLDNNKILFTGTVRSFRHVEGV